MELTPGYEALRRHRVSIPGATYFITICTGARATGLNEPSPSDEIKTQVLALETDQTLKVQAAVIMPDHLHLLFSVTGRLSVGQIVGRLKSKTRAALASQGLIWQGNYYEHRLRVSDPREEVLRYLFLNPYRAGIIPQTATYPHFWIGTAEAEWFHPMLDDTRPFLEWLK
jgi:putative transposase